MRHLRGVADEAADEVGPGDVVHGVLLGSDGAGDHLGVEMLGKHVQQAARQGTPTCGCVRPPQQRVT